MFSIAVVCSIQKVYQLFIFLVFLSFPSVSSAFLRTLMVFLSLVTPSVSAISHSSFLRRPTLSPRPAFLAPPARLPEEPSAKLQTQVEGVSHAGTIPHSFGRLAWAAPPPVAPLSLFFDVLSHVSLLLRVLVFVSWVRWWRCCLWMDRNWCSVGWWSCLNRRLGAGNYGTEVSIYLIQLKALHLWKREEMWWSAAYKVCCIQRRKHKAANVERVYKFLESHTWAAPRQSCTSGKHICLLTFVNHVAARAASPLGKHHTFSWGCRSLMCVKLCLCTWEILLESCHCLLLL